jgi:CRISPR/Cas system-associated endonuclease Cas1
MKSKIENEVNRAEVRLESVEGTQRLLLRMTFDSLAKAERLRQAVRAYQRAFATRQEGRTRAAMFQILNTLTTSFHKPLPARDMRKVRAFLKGVS